MRQGDALAPILFHLVLEAVFQKMNITSHIGTKSTQIIAYADDVAVVSRSKNALKYALVNIESEARQRGQYKYTHMHSYVTSSSAYLWLGYIKLIQIMYLF